MYFHLVELLFYFISLFSKVSRYSARKAAALIVVPPQITIVKHI